MQCHSCFQDRLIIGNMTCTWLVCMWHYVFRTVWLSATWRARGLYVCGMMFSGPFDYRQHDVHVACLYVAWCFQDRLIIGNMTCTWLVCMWHDVFRTVWLSATWRARGLYVCGMMFSGPFDDRQHDVHLACMYVAWCFQDRLIIGNMTCTWLVCMWHDVFRTVWLSATWRARGLSVCGMMFSGPFDYRQHDVHVACMYVAWCFQDRLIIGNMTCTWLVCMWHDVFRTVWLSATWRAPGLSVCGMMFSGPFDYQQHDVHLACMYVAWCFQDRLIIGNMTCTWLVCMWHGVLSQLLWRDDVDDIDHYAFFALGGLWLLFQAIIWTTIFFRVGAPYYIIVKLYFLVLWEHW